MENGLKKALDETFDSTKALSDLSDLAAASLDSIMFVPLWGAPILQFALLLFKLRKSGIQSIKDAKLKKKLAVFFDRTTKISEHDRADMAAKLAVKDEYSETIFEKVILLIDRLDETKKAEIIGNLFIHYVERVISLDTFLRLSSIVEKVFLGDLIALYNYHCRYRTENPGVEDLYVISDATKSVMVSFGLMKIELTEIPSQTLRAKGIFGSEPALNINLTSLGDEFANLMFFDKDNKEFMDYRAYLMVDVGQMNP